MDVTGYERDEWKAVEVAGPAEISNRRHWLTVVAEPELGLGLLSMLGKINTDDFLDTGPGFLLCLAAHCQAGTLKCAPGVTETYEEAIEKARHRIWQMRFEFIEQTPQRWNEVFFPAAAGKFVRTKNDAFEGFPMASLLGRSHFDLSA